MKTTGILILMIWASSAHAGLMIGSTELERVENMTQAECIEWGLENGYRHVGYEAFYDLIKRRDDRDPTPTIKRIFRAFGGEDVLYGNTGTDYTFKPGAVINASLILDPNAKAPGGTFGAHPVSAAAKADHWMIRDHRPACAQPHQNCGRRSYTVPEPGALAMFGVGMSALFLLRKRSTAP